MGGIRTLICLLAVFTCFDAWADDAPPADIQAERLLDEAESLMKTDDKRALSYEKAKAAIALIDRTDRKPDALLGKALHIAGRAGIYSGDKATVEALFKRAAQVREDALGPRHFHVADSINNLAFMYKGRGALDEARELFQRAYEIYRESLGEAHQKTALAINNLGSIHEDKGEYEQALPLYERALKIFESSSATESVRVSASLRNVANAHLGMGSLDQALALLERKLAIDERLHGEAHEEVASTLASIARLHEAAERDTQAIAALRRLLSIQERSAGEESPGVASTLNDLVNIYTRRGEYDRALKLGVKSLAIFEKSFGREHPAVAVALNDLGVIYHHQGKYALALPKYEESLAIRKATLGPSHLKVAGSLMNLAVIHSEMTHYPRALALFEESRSIYEAGLGDQHPQIGKLSSNLARLYIKTSSLKKAQAALERALAIFESSLGDSHPQVATTLSGLAEVHELKGEYESALSLQTRSLSIVEQALGPHHLETANILNSLATLHITLGQLDPALPLLKRSLKIREVTLGSDHIRVAQVLSNLAVLYSEQGDLVRSQALHERALKIYESALGSKHPEVASSLENLATILVEKEDHEAALKLLQRSADIFLDALGPAHPEVATSYGNQAVVLDRLGRSKEALALYEKSLSTYEKAYGPKHLEVARTLMNIATIYGIENEHDQALRRLNRALNIQEKILGKQHPDVATTLQNIATVHKRSGRLNDAQSSYEEVLSIRKNSLPPTHPDIAFTHGSLAVIHWLKGAIGRANSAFAAAFDIEDRFLRRNLNSGTPESRRRFARRFDPTRSEFLSFALATRDADIAEKVTTQLARVLVRGKARASEATHSLAQDTRRQMTYFAEIRDLQSQISALAYATHNPRMAARLKARLETLKRQQAAIGKKSEATPASGLATIVRHLDNSAGFIEWFAYDPYDPKNAELPGHQAPPPSLAALVLRRGEPPRLFGLGPLAAIAKDVAAARDYLSSPKAGLEPHAKALYQRLIKPLEGAIDDATQLIIAPDGPLHQVAFAALMDSEGKWLAEKFTVRQVTTARDLVHLAEEPFPARQPALLLADARFDRAPSRTVQVAATRGSRAAQDLAKLSMAPLPGTRAEAEGLAKLLDLKGERVGLGAQASETRLKAVKGPQILHIATHGFFLPDVTDEQVRDEPMLRSGIALAGFNERSGAHHEDDGVLTALDVSGLDLYGTELVVLSACETGLGEVENGEGLFGLKRALLLAGSRSQILSLWKVDDHATQALMTAYYTRLKSGDDRLDALRQVQLDMLSGRLTAEGVTATDQRGATVAGSSAATPSRTKGWRHPYYWASFTLSGADGPIELSNSR